MADDRAFEAGVGMVVLGGSLLIRGFTARKRAGVMEDTPTAKIATAATGDLVELKGRVVKRNSKLAPLSGKKCEAYVLTLQEKIESSKRSYWSTVAIVCSDQFLFIEDKSKALAAVDLGHCEFSHKQEEEELRFNDNAPNSVPESLRQFFDNNGLLKFKEGNFLLSGTYRVKESIYKEGAHVYCLGCAYSIQGYDSFQEYDYRVKFLDEEGVIVKTGGERIADYTSSPLGIKWTDTNRDGYLQMEEIENMKAKLKKKYASEVNYDYKSAKIVISKSPNPKETFDINKPLLSTFREKELVKKKRFKSIFHIFGGPLLIGMGVFILVDRYWR